MFGLRTTIHDLLMRADDRELPLDTLMRNPNMSFFLSRLADNAFNQTFLLFAVIDSMNRHGVYVSDDNIVYMA